MASFLQETTTFLLERRWQKSIEDLPIR
jgi:hypothetical protein